MKKTCVKYSDQDYQIIRDNYNPSISILKNAKVIASMLNDRTPNSLEMKLAQMKKRGLLATIVTQEVKIENDFQTRLVDIIINHASADFKEKLFIGMLSKVGSGSGL